MKALPPEVKKANAAARHARWRAANKPVVAGYGRRYFSENKETIRERRKGYLEKSLDLRRTTKRLYRTRNRASVLKAERARKRRKRLTDPNYRLACCLRARLSDALRSARANKTTSTMALLGCTIPFLRQYLEARFLPGMSWENFGEWHVDHRLPCASFDLLNPSHQRACFHYINLRPLWAIDNIRKGATVPAFFNSNIKKETSCPTNKRLIQSN